MAERSALSVKVCNSFQSFGSKHVSERAAFFLVGFASALPRRRTSDLDLQLRRGITKKLLRAGFVELVLEAVPHGNRMK